MKQLLENSRTNVSVMAQAKAGRRSIKHPGKLRKTPLVLAIAAALTFSALTYAAPGDRVGGEFRVNTTIGDQSFPTISLDGDGDFVVAWQSSKQDGSGYGIYAQRFNAAGERQDGEFRVNTTTAGNQVIPAIALWTPMAISWWCGKVTKS